MTPGAAPSIDGPRRADVVAVLSLCVVILAAHVRSLWFGWFMDDYAHYTQLRAAGWSIGDLAHACRLELVGGLLELWWLPDCTLRFFRPLSFGAMKAVYTLFGWDPLPAHAASLCWHALTCALLYSLLRRFSLTPLAAAAVATLFAIHPGHVATVQWIAAQTELMVTAFTLAALHCWGSFRGWWGESASRIPSALATLACYVLALGCRENAIMLPCVLAAVEIASLARRRIPALFVLFALALLAGAYLLARSHYLGGAALPPRPYVIPPSDPDFLRYVFDKSCYYLLAEFLAYPCVPIGGLPYLREHPWLLYAPAALLAGALGLLVWRRRATVLGWLAPACLFGFMAPVLPAFESPHHLYLPGVGWALTLGLLAQPSPGARSGRARFRLTARNALALLMTAFFALATHISSLSLETGHAVEQRVIAEIAGAPTPPKSGETIYVVNLPIVAHYVKLGVQEKLGLRDLRAVALTWSPRLLGLVAGTELTQRTAQSIEIATASPYLAGPIALLARQANQGELPFRVGEPIVRQGYRVTVLEADEQGVRRLRVDFDVALGSGAHLFWGSQARWATQLAP